MDRLARKYGPLMFHQSGGCCDGSSPMCYPRGEFLVGDSDVLIGDAWGHSLLYEPQPVRVLEAYAADSGCGAGTRRDVFAGGAGGRAVSDPVARVYR